MASADHHSAYLAQAVAALTPEGHRRVDELIDQLAAAVANREWLTRFAKARRDEADDQRVDPAQDAAIDRMLTSQELDALYTGFATIRDTERLGRGLQLGQRRTGAAPGRRARPATLTPRMRRTRAGPERPGLAVGRLRTR